MDKREQILQRLSEIAADVPGIVSTLRNQDEIAERERPAIVIFDADETANEGAGQRGYAGHASNLVEMTPEVLILLGATPEHVGTALNAVRANLVRAVLLDTQLIAFAGQNGHVRYAGCSTHLGHGRSMEGSMAVHFALGYVLRPEQL